MADSRTGDVFVYVGTYTLGTKSEGIYVYRMDPSTGSMEYASKATGIVDPTFLAVHPGRKYLYAVCIVDSALEQRDGAVNAYSIDQKTGELTYLNSQSTKGQGPCYVSVDSTGKFALAANYASGSVCVLPVEDDGSLGEATGFAQHTGSSVNPERQDGPHAHSIMVDPSNRYAFVPDLGQDKVVIYELDHDTGGLSPNEQPWAKVADGAGPRHFDFHPTGRYAYVINELDSTITAFAYDQSKGILEELETVPALPEGYDGVSHCADIHVSQSGQYLYGSNRGHDSIVIYSISGATGRLTYVGHESTQGETPRNFAISADGTLLLAANQESDTVVAFRVDQATGELRATGEVAEVPSPVCLKLLAL